MDRENTLPPQLRNTTKFDHLPQEIIEEILSRLTVKSLLTLKCVSKSWRCLIGSERFIKTHLEKSRKKQSFANWRVVLNCDSRNPTPGLKRCSMTSYMREPDVDPSPIDDPTNNHLMLDSSVVGHSNGLLCILKKPGCLFLWNPATRISAELPKLDLPITKYGFGWDEQSGAHKVFAVMSRKNENENEEGEEWIGNLYSSKTDSWKIVEHGSRDLYDRAGEVVYGKIHWPTKGGYIETFDLRSEMFGMIELPFKNIPEVSVHRMWLEPQEEFKEGCLEVVCDLNNNNNNDNDNNIRTRMSWEMKKYGVKESWVKMCSGNIPSNQGDNHMLWMVDKGVVKFSARSKIVGASSTHYYIESLVSPVPHKDQL